MCVCVMGKDKLRQLLDEEEELNHEFYYDCEIGCLRYHSNGNSIHIHGVTEFFFPLSHSQYFFRKFFINQNDLLKAVTHVSEIRLFRLGFFLYLFCLLTFFSLNASECFELKIRKNCTTVIDKTDFALIFLIFLDLKRQSLF